MSALALGPQILLTLVLLVSGISKLPAQRGTAEAMVSLRLPLRSLHRQIAAALPVLEIVLAVAWWVPLRPLQILDAAAVLALMVTYLVIIARALTFGAPVECSCFGTLASPTVSRATLLRNILLVACAATAAVVLAAAPAQLLTLVGPLALGLLALLLLVTIVLTTATLGGVRSGRTAPQRGAPSAMDGGTHASGDPSSLEAGEDELADYERAPTPFGVLRRADGSAVTLAELVQTTGAAQLLVWLNEGCGPCVSVIGQIPAWRTQLDPYVQIQAVFRHDVALLSDATRSSLGDGVAWDVENNVAAALEVWASPQAVLLGADGLLAGGPVQGSGEVEQFVADILEQLQEAAQAGELPTAEQQEAERADHPGEQPVSAATDRD